MNVTHSHLCRCVLSQTIRLLLFFSQPAKHTHTRRHSLEGDPLPGFPDSLGALLSRDRGMNERPGNLTVSNDRRAEVELRAWPIMLPRDHSPKKKEGRGRTEVWPHPSCNSSNPHTRDFTNVTSCLCHRADCIVISDWL